MGLAFAGVAALLCASVPARAGQVCDRSFADHHRTDNQAASERRMEAVQSLQNLMQRDRTYRIGTRTRDYQVFSDAAGLVIWTFTTPAHPAYPSLVCREAVQDSSGAWSMTMRVTCFGTTQVCDQLVEDFKSLNKAMRADLQRRFPAP
jgi:hypothetical protein